jgi:hypothetical protein
VEVTEGALSAMGNVLGSSLCDSNALLSGVREPIHYFQYFFTYLGEIITHNPHTHTHIFPLNDWDFRRNRGSEKNTQPMSVIKFWNFVILDRIYFSEYIPDIMSDFEFGENQRNKWHTVLRSVGEFPFVCYTFIFPNYTQ